MIIVVNDASILIDLLKIDLSDQFFYLPLEMYTTDLVSSEIQDESAKRFEKYIEKKMINIYSFSDKEWSEVVYIKNENPPLSMADCSCFWLCKKLSATLLTSDGKLRSSASEENIPVHGILWVFEELILQKEITVEEAVKKLHKLMEINARLPHKECNKTIKKWKS